MVTSRQTIKAKIPVKLYLVLAVLLPNAHLCNILFIIMSTTSQYKTLKQIQFKIQMYVNEIYQVFLFNFCLQLILKCIIDLYLNRKKIKAVCLCLQKDSTTPPLTSEEEDEPENLITVTTSQTRGVKRTIEVMERSADTTRKVAKSDIKTSQLPPGCIRYINKQNNKKE